MRPLRKGAARRALATGLAQLAQYRITRLGLEIGKAIHEIAANEPGESVDSAEAAGSSLGEDIASLQAAVLGGAIEAALDEIQQGMNPKYLTEFKRDFWRLTNENTWRMTRALAASGLLDKVGET